ncbi:hypothetical protein HYFRA_00000086 [Hymenoscyphus fraxineus]|uniref:Uncharacterized protein n=1 Tax=Hymenoscyphus fraxineus TaxID=746836 RepID=A0A9N9L417_9HELO|nr:hypothetical protein HYFRA_00000086 [Hymenoscyphus fraxineus]
MAPTTKNDALGDLIGHIPHGCPTSSKSTIQCCCGRKDCAYLEHNSSAVEDLERELHTAATLGQALLVRHEAYMYDAERDRMEMNGKIDQLEHEKKLLEEQNARSAEENQQLSEQLEGLSTTLSDSEIHIKSLESTLQSTHQELRRLEALAFRTQDLEIQLAAVEQEQDLLQKAVAKSEAEERSAIQRWKQAERRLHELEDQLERIECEAREERERHVEVIGRMERQRAVENELGSAAGRLKAAAATTGNSKNGSNVVSHFVKDILQDNANLQLGIMELREMLLNSNDEVQALREQLLLHQPLDNSEGEKTPTLGAELASKSQPATLAPPPELHIHHHYHVPKKEETRKPKKKRLSLSASIFTPPRNGHSPISPRRPRNRDTASTILSQTSVTIPAPRTPTNRWSMQSAAMSDFAPSSVPSSPQSAYRSSTLFDRSFDIDSSRPTSPGSSIDPMSPQFGPMRHRKKLSDVSTRSFGGTNFQPHNVIHEEDDDVQAMPSLNTPRVPSLNIDTSCAQDSRDVNYEQTPNKNWNDSFQPSLRRTSSHESILSVSGIDIHTLKSRPSQLAIGSNNSLLLPRTRLLDQTSMVSVNTEVTAQPTLSRFGHESTSYLRSSIQGNNSDARSVSSGGSVESTSSRVGGKLGGWVFGRWGATPTKSGPSASDQQRAVSTPPTQESFMARPPGINQKGPIPGLIRKVSKAPSKVRSNSVDREALKEILDEVAGLGLG